MRLISACAGLLAGTFASAGWAATPELRVSQACAGASHCFESLGAASAEANRDTGTGWITIRVGQGSFREKVTISRNKVRLIGSGAARTKLHFDAVAQTSGAYHRGGWGTPGSATLTIDASDVIVSAMTIENDYDYLANDVLPDDDTRKIGNPQAVALLADIHSDRVSIRKSALMGYQDTLFANGKRVHITDSLVAGNIDFIFGNGMVLIERSEIRSRRRAAAMDGEPFQSFIAAPSTLLDQPVGIVFYRSRLTREAGVPDKSVALARPWHPTTRFADGRYANPRAIGQVSFIDCFLDAHIAPDHWATMKGTARSGTMSDVFRPQDSRFFERGSTGPGAKARNIGMPSNGLGEIAPIKRIIFENWPDAQ
ncbi:pectin esterase [Sphingomonas populi]|uniref:Pectin esterase n=1 Tax=Sphingomonas populi TaxID=2484750 RepID=A0A4Q6XV44_9SPHN|nr:pectinesterase family protein [Sphingomonas populi]RZF60527.1 pectin esterase [Sphingomonas populi]